jgi:hypothetical protein
MAMTIDDLTAAYSANPAMPSSCPTSQIYAQILQSQSNSFVEFMFYSNMSGPPPTPPFPTPTP